MSGLVKPLAKRQPLGTPSPQALARTEVNPPGTRANPETRPPQAPRAPRHVETFCSARHVLHFSQYVIVRETLVMAAGILDMAAIGDAEAPADPAFNLKGALHDGEVL